VTVIVLDYGLGNLKSLSWGLDRIGCSYKITDDPEELSQAKQLIVPGVGSFGQAMSNLNSLGLKGLIFDLVSNKKIKILGICLGMQILFEGSDESAGVDGLSVLEGFFNRLDDKTSHVPHMGWNNLENRKQMDSKYLLDVPTDADFYYVHSYGLLETSIVKHWMSIRGEQGFVAYLEHENITCAQFHPEKSHMSGLRLLKNWVELNA